ncbi:hypothetical protein B566_EDAN013758 [Ephemera danica]|nr:hypothetical protein B566_EDAN013758 [Ephemera danica]
MGTLLFFVFTLSYIIIGISTATIKTWYPNTNFWNPENWDLKRSPCRSDLVQFPATAEVAVSLHAGTTALREIVLPINGELVLAEGQLLVTGLSGTTSAGCPGEELTFIGGGERAWLDSKNWRDADGNDWPGGEDSPVPHAERVPCPTDQVVFPEGSTFKVRLPDIPKNYPQLLSHLSRLDSNHHQIILREKGVYSARSAFAADKLADELRNDRTMGVVSVLVKAAGEPLTNLGSTWSIVLVTLLLIILMVGSAYLVSNGYQRYRSGATFPAIFPRMEMPSFHFRRFENRSASVDGEVEITKGEESMGESERDSTSGINVSGGLLVRPKASGRSMTVENPTYRALQAAAQSDPLEEEPEEAEEVDITPQFASSKYTSLHEEE